MSSITMVSSALVNALAFTGSSYGFLLLNKGWEEIKRYDLAIAKLAVAHNEWVKQRQQRIDMINQKLYDEKKVEIRFYDLDSTMAEYK